MRRLKFAEFSSINWMLLPTAMGLALLLFACSHKPSEQNVGARPTTQQTSAQRATSQQQAEDGQWSMPAKDYASTRYSGLDQINTENVKNLKLAWTFSTGVLRGHEAAPIVVNNTMYIVTPYPNTLYALDLRQPGGPIKWVYKPNPAAASQGVACCDVVNRGAVYYNGKIFFNTLDMHTIAIDAETGKQVWNVTLGDINKGESMTMAPLVLKGKVLVGNSGGELGVRGWLTALDANTGKIAWRAYTTGPDKEVLIGPNFKPFYSQDRGQDLGVKTWPPDLWKIGRWLRMGLDLVRSRAGSDLLWHE